MTSNQNFDFIKAYDDGVLGLIDEISHDMLADFTTFESIMSDEEDMIFYKMHEGWLK